MYDRTSRSAKRPKAVFSARGVTKVYDMGEVQVHALRAADLDLYAGEMMGLLGPPGSGKSTRLNSSANSTIDSEPHRERERRCGDRDR